MQLSNILKSCNITYDKKLVKDIFISGISCDSRLVKKNNVFFALEGTKNNGFAFIQQACKNGAVAIIGKKKLGNKVIETLPFFHSENPRAALSKAARKFYGDIPQYMAAITGTAGKTSVANFLYQIWRKNNIKAAMIGTNGTFNASGKKISYGLTTPSPTELYATLAKLKKQGITHCVLEASSHGLQQNRLEAIDFFVGTFTNLKRDHLDYHKTMKNYRNAKLKLFNERIKPKQSAIICADDENAKIFIQTAKAKKLKIKTVGYAGEYIKIINIKQKNKMQEAKIKYRGKEIFVSVPLLGEFQLLNALLAAAMAIDTGILAKNVFASLAKLRGVKGRLQYVGKKENSLCFIDYAHKPDSLAHVLQCLRVITKGKLFLVFGCGGERDKGKRKLMGKIAKANADIVIITDDNPRCENAKQIRKEILQGVPTAKQIANRRLAIKTAFNALKTGDCLLVAGKGHESGQIIGTKIFPFDDAKEIKKLLVKKIKMGGRKK